MHKRSFVADLILATTLANTSWWWPTHTQCDGCVAKVRERTLTTTVNDYCVTVAHGLPLVGRIGRARFRNLAGIPVRGRARSLAMVCRA